MRPYYLVSFYGSDGSPAEDFPEPFTSLMDAYDDVAADIVVKRGLETEKWEFNLVMPDGKATATWEVVNEEGDKYLISEYTTLRLVVG